MKVPATSFVIFGITGDLAARKLMPALYALHRNGLLNPESRIIGYARSDLTDTDLRERLRNAVQEYGEDFNEQLWDSLAEHISYQRGAYDDVEDFRQLGARLAEYGLPETVFYTATPPSTYSQIIEAIAAAGLTHDAAGVPARIVIEKPFGHDLQSAEELNALLLAHFSEDQIYRIDHYLAKETAQNLAVLRFANTLFEPTWNNRYIDHVQITMEETVGVEGRGSFYEEAGVIRDVFQNHLLQLVALVAMEPPARYDARSVRNEKVKVFEAMECAEPEDAVFGQYVTGGGMEGYREEDGVSPESNQATFAAVEFRISNWRWQGVPFYVRSGKRLKQKVTEIVLHYKIPPHNPFDLAQPLRGDRLILRLSPDEGISIRFNIKDPGQEQEIKVDRMNLDFSYSTYFPGTAPDAYETLLLDVMRGDATLFMRADEVEAQWKVVAPLLDRSSSTGPVPEFYGAGSSGPRDAYRLLERAGRHWHRPGND